MIGAPHAAVTYQLPEHEIRGVGATAKQIPCAPMITAVLMPMTSPARRHQRAAGIARVERRVGLDHVVDQAAALTAQRAAQRRDHAGGDGGLKPSGLPMATTSRPRRSLLELPRPRPAAPPSRPATAPDRCPDRRPSAARVVRARPASHDVAAPPPAAPRDCWSRMSPSGATTTPEPAPSYPVALGAARYEGRNSLTTADEKGDDGRTNAIDHVDDGARIGVK